MNRRQQRYYDLLVTEATTRGFEVIGEYIDAKTSIGLRCRQGHEMRVTPDSFKRGSGCPRCAKNCPIQAEEAFQVAAKQRGYQILGEYISAHAKIRMRCASGHEIRITASNFRSGQECAKCARLCPVQAEQGLRALAAQKGYDILGPYVNTGDPIWMKCPVQHVIEMIPDNFKKGNGCIVCARRCPKAAKDSFYTQAATRGYEIIGEYVNTATKVGMRCTQGHTIEMVPDSFKSGDGCARCAKNSPTQAAEELLAVAMERGYEVVGSYVRSNSKIRLRCLEGHEIDIRPNDFKRGKGCSICQETAGEQLIRATLKDLGLPVEGQYRIPSLENRRCDFATVWEGRTVIIEWDGGQHFVDNGWFDEMDMHERQRIDILKTQTVIDSQKQIIRVDDSWLSKSVKEIGEFLTLAMESRQQLVVSNMRKYQWLLEEVIYCRPGLKIRRPVEANLTVEPTRRVRLVIKSRS